MFEATKDFFADALNFKLENQDMLDILMVLANINDLMPFGQALYELHQLTQKQRNYICCVLLERDQDPIAWAKVWDEMEAGAFD